MTDDRTTHSADFTRCDGQTFKQLIQAGLTWLERHQAAINALNVYPVPDGDTGTNMLLTMRSTMEEAYRAPGNTVHVVDLAVADATPRARSPSTPMPASGA